MKTIIHIGTEKTGTTSIQATLAKARPALLESGILFPETLGPANHLALAAMFQRADKVDDLRRRFKIASADDLASYRRKMEEGLAEERKRTACRRLVLSSEHCSSRLIETDEIAGLRDFVAQHGGPTEDARIIVYLRRQDELLQSLYHTSVANGSTQRFSYRRKELCPPYFDFERMLRRWEKVFGRQALAPSIYDEAKQGRGGVVGDFFASAELDFDWEPFTDYPRNRSLDGRQLEALRVENEKRPVELLDEEDLQQRADLIEALRRESGDEPPLGSRNGREEFLRQFEEGNRQVARKYFGREKLFGEG